MFDFVCDVVCGTGGATQFGTSVLGMAGRHWF